MGGNIIICGAPRAGTTSLYRYLAAHPEVVISNKKEMNFFLGGSYPESEYKEASYDIYKQQFGDVDSSQWTLEASPAYMHPWLSKKVACRLKKVVPNAKLIFLLRDPILRALSQYNVDKRAALISSDVSFEEYVEMCLNESHSRLIVDGADVPERVALEIGCYSSILRDYFSCVDRENILVVFLEVLEKNPRSEMRRVCHHIGLDSGFYDSYSFSRENRYLQPRSRIFYKMMAALNQFSEPILNRSLSARRLLRSIYNALNSKENRVEDGVSVSVYERLLRYYAPYNSELIKQLEADLEMGDMPGWIAKPRDVL